MEDVLAGPQPWRFGHLLLPGGSTNLGSSGYELRQRTRAPLVGTLLEVRRCSVDRSLDCAVRWFMVLHYSKGKNCAPVSGLFRVCGTSSLSRSQGLVTLRMSYVSSYHENA